MPPPVPSKVEVVRAIYDAWRDGLRAHELIADDFEYVNPDYAVEPGTRRGRRALLGVLEVFPDFTVEAERFIDAGDDTVVVLGTASGTSDVGAQMRWRMGYVWTVEDGRATRMRWFNDHDEALAAAGLAEDRL